MNPLLRLFVTLASIPGMLGLVAVEPAHPFILMTRAEAAAIKERLARDPDARLQLERTIGIAPANTTMVDTLKALVLDDEKAYADQKRYLIGFIGSDPARFTESGGRHFDNHQAVLAYDLVHDRLTAEERTRVEDTFRVYIRHQLADRFTYTRTSWLPNMQWPRPLTALLMAIVIRDEEAMTALMQGPGGWTWYFDEYLVDGGFYNEEFGKHYSVIGKMLLVCEAFRHLGRDRLGYGYTGRTGATMRTYIESILRVGLPMTDIGSARPAFPKLTMGDARGVGLKDKGGTPRAHILQHAVVNGWTRDGVGGSQWWTAANMNGRDYANGKVQQMNTGLVFELAAARWPDAGFQYFLYHMRGPGDDRYIPSLFWNLAPVTKAHAVPPAAPSQIAPGRGFALLRSEESPAYWESPAPTVGLQFASYYVHYTHDCFSLLGFSAFHRNLYLNRQISEGYAGDDPFTDSVRGQSGVVVDNLRARFVDSGDGEPSKVGLRSDLRGPIRFCAIRADGVYPDVAQERALILTRDYLIDGFRLVSPRDRTYDWQVQAIGRKVADPGKTWVAAPEIQGGALYSAATKRMGEILAKRGAFYDHGDPQRMDPGATDWSVAFIQSATSADTADTLLGPAWFAAGVGVRVHLLGEPGTTVFTGRTPGLPDNEAGGTSLIVRRTAAATTFAAVHVPFQGGPGAPLTVTRFGTTAQGMGLRIGGPGERVNDLAAIGWGDGSAPISLATADESLTATGHAWIRIHADRVEAWGGITALRLRIPATVTGLTLNGVATPCRIGNGRINMPVP